METFNADPSVVPVAKTIEFVGVGPPGKRRLIDVIRRCLSGCLSASQPRRSPDHDWISLFSQWGVAYNLQVSISIRSGNDALLILKEVTPLHLSMNGLSGPDIKTVKALISLRGEQVVFGPGSASHRLRVGSVPAGLRRERHSHPLTDYLKLNDKRGPEDRIQLVLPRVRRAEHELRSAG